MIKKEWKELWKSTWFKVVLCAIIVIPTIYSCVFLGSMWDPYGNAKKIPVAVVNKDEEVSYNGTTLNVGKELVNNLQENKSMDFHFVDEKNADTGLESGEYYMKITIPADFSNNATTLLEESPKKMILEYTTNPGTNYIASKMDDSAIAKIKESVSASVTKTYASTIFDQIGTLSTGLQEASDGTGTLNQGFDDLVNGNGTITTNLNTLASSSLVFKDGANTLSVGLQNYTDAVSKIYQGSQDLVANNERLKQGVNSLDTGLTTMQQGATAIQEKLQVASKSIGEGLESSAQDLQTLQAGNTAVNQGATKLYQSLSSKEANQALTVASDDATIIAIQNASNLSDVQKASIIATIKGSQQTNAALLGSQENPGLLPSTIALSSKNKEAIDMLTTNLQTIKEGLDGTNSQMGAITGLQTLNQGISQAKQSVSQQLVPSIEQYTGGVATLNAGLSTLSSNNETLLNGSAQLASGSMQIQDGASVLAQGSNTLGQGLLTAKEGTNVLNTKLQEGANQSKLATTKNTVEMMATPVEVNHQEISTVDNNGHAMAPYMMSVALYVACMAFTLMYPLLKDIQQAESGFKYWLSKASVMYTVSTIQALVMIGALMLVNGLEPQQVLTTFIFAIVVSAAFMTMIVFFNITLGKVGSFLVLVFMVLQLGGAAGTYPLETSSVFYKILHPFMPFSYSVEGFRHALSMSNFLTIDMLVFIGIIVVFAILSILFYKYRKAHPHTKLEKAFD